MIEIEISVMNLLYLFDFGLTVFIEVLIVIEKVLNFAQLLLYYLILYFVYLLMNVRLFQRVVKFYSELLFKEGEILLYRVIDGVE